MQRLTLPEIEKLTRSAIAKVDGSGQRGLERVTHAEIEALVVAHIALLATIEELRAEQASTPSDTATKETSDV